MNNKFKIFIFFLIIVLLIGCPDPPQLFQIVYHNLEGAENHASNPNGYTEETSTIILQNPTKIGYSFNGWFANADLTGIAVTEIASGSTSDIDLYADWTANTYTVTFNSLGGSETEPSTKVVTFDDSYGDLPSTEKNGYLFSTWNTLESGEGKVLNTSSIVKIGFNHTLYAIWEAEEYSITYNLNGGTNNEENPMSYTIESETITFKDPTKMGFTFIGWYIDEETSTEINKIDSGSTGEKILFAKWTVNTYVVSLDKQGGAGGSDQVEVVYYNAMPEGKSSPTKTGYKFDGYYGAINGEGKKYYNEEMNSTNTWTFDYNGTIYAKWTAKAYAVTLDFQGGKDGTLSVIAFYDQFVPAASPPTKIGYTFNGYFSETNGGGIQYYGPNMEMLRKWDVDNSATLYANWTINTYTIFFEKNGGIGDMDNQDITFNDTVSLIPNTFTKTGYSFSGWALSNTGEVAFEEEASITMSAKDETLWAKWQPKSYTITFDKQGGIGGSNQVEATYDANMRVALAPTKNGYNFAGYFTATGGEGIQYYNADMTSTIPWSIATDTNLYAAWTAKIYTVVFNEQGGTSSDPEMKQVTFNQTYGNLATTSRSGYSFGGWWTETNGGGTEISSGTTVIFAENHFLYAKWIPNDYTITFNAQGGALPEPGTKIVTYDQTYGELASTSKTGYTHSGWNTELDGSGSLIVAETHLVIPNNHTLYAQWTPNIYTVTLDKQGGTSGSDQVEATFNATMPVAVAPTKIGYNFAGYFTATEGEGDKYYNTGMSSAKGWNISSDTTLYADWDLVNYTLTYNLNGGINDSTNPTIYTIETPTFSLENSSRTGYTFAGWFLDSSFDTPFLQIELGSTGDVEVWANWIPIVYDINYNLNSGINNISNPETYTIETTTFEFNMPTRDYYDFLGWYRNSEFVGEEIEELEIGTHGNVDLYAKWTPTVYDITYNLDTGTNNVANPSTFTIESSTITFAEPSRTGYYFGGWYTTSDFGFDYLKLTIEAGSHIDVELFAKWNQLYSVGDSGPTGGTVFFDRNDERWNDLGYLGDFNYQEEDSWRYLEAAIFDLPDSYTWMPSDVEPFADNKYFNTADSEYGNIGFGKSNTDLVRNYYSTKFNHACYAAWNNNHGMEGWFLPSLSELNVLLEAFVENPEACNLLVNRSYWSSTDLSWDQAWSIKYEQVGSSTNVVMDELTYQNKWELRYIRPVRMF